MFEAAANDGWTGELPVPVPCEPLMAEKKILLLSVPSGAGHTRAAEAIRSAAAGQGVTAVHLDATAFASPLRRAIYTGAYIFLVKRAPVLWS